LEPTFRGEAGDEPRIGPAPASLDGQAGRVATDGAAAPRQIEPAGSRFRLSNLTLRFLTAGVLIPPVIWLCQQGGPLYVAVIVLISVVGIHEFYQFIEAKGAMPVRSIGTVAAALLPLVVWVGDALYATSLMTAVLLGVMILQLAKREIQESIVSVSATFFGVVYVGWMMSHAVSVRFIQRDLVRRFGEPAAVAVPEDAGFFFMMLCLTTALLCDTGAFFVGRRWGRRPLAPTISPNKTVEGAAGGIAVGTVMAVATKVVFDFFVPGGLSHSFGYLATIAFGVGVSAFAVLGDLAESLLKRDAHVKDAGDLLPGVGGLLDRIDSVLFALPVTYYLLLAYYSFYLGL
jgi:phosphatidate cytidylyltransferase